MAKNFSEPVGRQSVNVAFGSIPLESVRLSLEPRIPGWTYGSEVRYGRNGVKELFLIPAGVVIVMDHWSYLSPMSQVVAATFAGEVQWDGPEVSLDAPTWRALCSTRS